MYFDLGLLKDKEYYLSDFHITIVFFCYYIIILYIEKKTTKTSMILWDFDPKPRLDATP